MDSKNLENESNKLDDESAMNIEIRQDECTRQGLPDLEDNFILQSFGSSQDEKVTDIIDQNCVCKLMSELDLARQTGSFSDVTLLIGEEKHPIRAHRIVLASMSEFFRAMFTTEFKEASQNEVRLPKLDIPTMKILLDFGYRGKVGITSKNIEKITKAADLFGMNNLLDKCVEFIQQQITIQNAVELFEFSDQISNSKLKEYVSKFITDNIESISNKNLDIMNMSPSLLLEIVADDCTVIDCNPHENEERLLKLGWDNLQTKPGDVWEASIPKLLKSVHLPLASKNFLEDLRRKLEDHLEAIQLVEKAIVLKRVALCSEYKVAIDETVRWSMARYRKAGRAFVECHNLINGNYSNWYGTPIYLNGKPWFLKAQITTCTVDGPTRKFLSVFLCTEKTTALCKFRFELVAPKRSTRKSLFSSEEQGFYGVDKDEVVGGYTKFIALPDLIENYYDKAIEKCVVVAHIVDIVDDIDNWNELFS